MQRRCASEAADGASAFLITVEGAASLASQFVTGALDLILGAEPAAASSRPSKDNAGT